MQSPFPHVLAPLPDNNYDYTFAFNGTWCRDTNCTATVVTRNIGDFLDGTLRAEAVALHRQQRALAVVGSVAWITDRPLLATLAETATAGVCLVMQNENWLRGDMFAQLPARTRRQLMDNPPDSSPDNDTPAAAWTAGEPNNAGLAAFPRMHRKSLVFCYADVAAPATLHPYAVWIGSYNLTDNARQSIEDAVMTHSESLAGFCYREFLCVLAHARPLPPTPSRRRPRPPADAAPDQFLATL